LGLDSLRRTAAVAPENSQTRALAEPDRPQATDGFWRVPLAHKKIELD
jgi:hypothetical protein